MSGGKGSNTTTTTLTPEQAAQIKAQTDFFTGTIAPTYTGAVQGATNVYNNALQGVTNAGQQEASTAGQVAATTGQTGESALRTGVTGLESLFSPDYEQTQIQAALAPAQAQYAQNIANQQAQFGGTGELGSERQALAGQQLAGANQAAQMSTAAQIQSTIEGQKAAAANQLAGIGQAGLGQALGATQAGVTAAMTPQQLYNQYASVIFGTPASSYALSPLGASTTTSQNNLGFKI
jgi:hypothetical protein